MKKSLLTTIFILVSFLTFGQKNVEHLKPESEGYFISPLETPYGIVATNNLCSAIYLIYNGEMETLATTPGCGRYYSISDDRTKIGFKKILPNGMQAPAVLNLLTKEVTLLADPTQHAGQVSFTKNGSVVYTIENELIISNQRSTRSIDLGTYVNYTAVSPNDDLVIYNTEDDQLFVLNLITKREVKITDGKGGYMLPKWSPDGTKVLYSTLGGTLKIWDRISLQTITLGEGLNAVWSDNSEEVIYYRLENENFVLAGSDLFKTNVISGETQNLTNTSDVFEMHPSFGENGNILFTTYKNPTILEASINQISSPSVLMDNTGSVLVEASKSQPSFPQNKQATTMVQGTVPYVNQIYDTPDWHGGSGSCAPTSASMVLGYYNRLPYWDITASWPSPHTSHYGRYIADKYRFNENYYNLVAGDANNNDAFGGYGYMWGASNSPHAVMYDYIQKHGITSVMSYSTTYTDVVGQVDSSYIMSICNLLTSAGHLTVAVGYVQGQHTVIFNDPYGNKNMGSWPNYSGTNSYYDWPGYNNGYQNLNTMAWSVTGKSSEPAYNDTIIDDIAYNHGFYIYNQGTSLMRYFRDKTTGGYNDHFWYTITTASTTIDTCYVTWTPNLNTSGNYEVSAYIPSTNANATTAPYIVNSDNGIDTVVVDQSANTGWVSLGTYPFTLGSGSVRLGDATGIMGQSIAFDAVKWVFASPFSYAGIAENKIEINSYPNPVTDNLTINGVTPYEILITNLEGKIVFKALQKNVIDLSELSAGMYQLQLFNESKELVHSEKLVKH